MTYNDFLLNFHSAQSLIGSPIDLDRGGGGGGGVCTSRANSKALITLCVFNIALSQKMQDSLRWIHLKVT